MGSAKDCTSIGGASSGSKSRPTIGDTPRTSKKFTVVHPTRTCSARPSPVRVPFCATAAAKSSNMVVCCW